MQHHARLRPVTDPDNIVISSYTYTLDNAGNRTKVVEHTGRTVEYTYDDTDKLLEEKITNPDTSVSVISYTYDKVGNRLTKTDNGFTTTYQYDDNNRLIQEDDIIYRYDNNGNLKEKTSAEETVEYFYDTENHLIRVETTRFGVTITVEYEYDAEGHRVRKVIDGTVVTNYLVDTNRDYAQVLEERDGDGNLLVRYVYGHDLISQTRGGATTYYHYDGLGSTRALTNGSEGITDTYTYDAFGNLLDKTGSTPNTHLYTGEFFDSNTGFYYLRARYMNPVVGRFVTMDTFAGFQRDPYSLHKYLYAHANPVMNIDPSGYTDLQRTTTSAGMVNNLSKIGTKIATKAVKTLVERGIEHAIAHPLETVISYLLVLAVGVGVVDMIQPATEEKDDPKELVNLDTVTAVAFTSAAKTSVKITLESYVAGKQMVMCKTALEELLTRNIKSAGFIEKSNLIIFLERVKPIPDAPSPRALQLMSDRKLGKNDIIIFGTGDTLGIVTMTADRRFVLRAERKGVKFKVKFHPSVPFMGI